MALIPIDLTEDEELAIATLVMLDEFPTISKLINHNPTMGHWLYILHIELQKHGGHLVDVDGALNIISSYMDDRRGHWFPDIPMLWTAAEIHPNANWDGRLEIVFHTRPLPGNEHIGERILRFDCEIPKTITVSSNRPYENMMNREVGDYDVNKTRREIIEHLVSSPFYSWMNRLWLGDEQFASDEIIKEGAEYYLPDLWPI